MNLQDLRAWQIQNGKNDQWWVSLDGVTEESPLRISQIADLLQSCDYAIVQVLHVSQSEIPNPQWIVIRRQIQRLSQQLHASQEQYNTRRMTPLRGSAPVSILVYFRRLTTFQGRINRLQYFYGWLLKIALIFAVGMLIILIDSASSNSDLSLIVSLPPCFLVIWINLSLQARRLHDLGYSGWWLLLLLVPFLNYLVGFIVSIFCFFQPGLRVPNKYGKSAEQIF
jgi:uncharacterized membrane protein YhaH (DUF805 family)